MACGSKHKELEEEWKELQQDQTQLQKRLQDGRRRLEVEKGKTEQLAKEESARKKMLARLEQVKQEEEQHTHQIQEKLEIVCQRIAEVHDRQAQEAASPSAMGDGALQVPPPQSKEPDPLEVEARRGVSWRELHEIQKQRLQRAQDEIKSICAKIEDVKAKTVEERRATVKAEEELSEKRQVRGRANAEKEAELAEVNEKCAALQRAQDGLENDAKELQCQLRTAIYHVGKKEREKELKEAELLEVRHNIVAIQDEMDEVNRQLQAQCARVQSVESSLRLSRDRGSKVASMREMLKEGHSALSQLCSHVERERWQREQCAQGLRQQQMRTELLLQLLHHFKSRTQDLAPQAILSQAAELMNGSTPPPARTDGTDRPRDHVQQ